MNINQFWTDVLNQDAKALESYFHEDAFINWHCTNEHFTAAEFIRANCEYPGNWAGEIEKKYVFDDTIITATHVYPKDSSLSFHVVSFIKVKDDKIVSVDEYWGDDGVAPQWRLDKHIGTIIK